MTRTNHCLKQQNFGIAYYVATVNCNTALCCAVSLSRIRLFATPWTVAHQAPLSMGVLQARILEWVAMPSSRGFSHPRDQTQVSCIAGRFFTTWVTKEAQEYWSGSTIFSRGSFWPRNQTAASCTAGRYFTSWATKEAQYCPTGHNLPRGDIPPRGKHSVTRCLV